MGICLQFAANHEISLFYEVSAKSGSNVNEAFEAFFKQVHLRVSQLLLIHNLCDSEDAIFTGNWSGCE